MANDGWTWNSQKGYWEWTGGGSPRGQPAYSAGKRDIDPSLWGYVPGYEQGQKQTADKVASIDPGVVALVGMGVELLFGGSDKVTPEAVEQLSEQGQIWWNYIKPYWEQMYSVEYDDEGNVVSMAEPPSFDFPELEYEPGEMPEYQWESPPYWDETMLRMAGYNPSFRADFSPYGSAGLTEAERYLRGFAGGQELQAGNPYLQAIEDELVRRGQDVSAVMRGDVMRSLGAQGMTAGSSAIGQQGRVAQNISEAVAGQISQGRFGAYEAGRGRQLMAQQALGNLALGAGGLGIQRGQAQVGQQAAQETARMQAWQNYLTGAAQYTQGQQFGYPYEVGYAQDVNRYGYMEAAANQQMQMQQEMANFNAMMQWYQQMLAPMQYMGQTGYMPQYYPNQFSQGMNTAGQLWGQYMAYQAAQPPPALPQGTQPPVGSPYNPYQGPGLPQGYQW